MTKLDEPFKTWRTKKAMRAKDETLELWEVSLVTFPMLSTARVYWAELEKQKERTK